MEQKIWNCLKESGFNDFAVAGIMGNLFAESGLKSNNVEDSSGYNDLIYTQCVDNGSYANFANDRIGYGLAQWTDPSRKQKLYNYLKSNGMSISDIDGQLQYLVYELKNDFKQLYKELLEVKTVNEASNKVLIKFENPADKSDAVKRKRATYSYKYYNAYANKAGSEVKKADNIIMLKKGSAGPAVAELQQSLIRLGFNCGIAGVDGDFGNATHEAVVAFQTKYNLEVDGVVGNETMQKIQTLLAAQPAKTNKNYTASALIAIAANEIGYHEKRSNANLDDKTVNAGAANFTKYARDLAQKGYYNGSKQGFAWCDVFVDWCFLQLCGGDAVEAQILECQTGPYGAGCSFSAQYYKQQGRWSTTPALGAQIFFIVGGDINHTGIVAEINGNTIVTIEGNTNEQVAKRTYNLPNASIAGYGLPKYVEESPQDTFTPYKVKITAKKLNVRANPDIEAPVIAILQQGSIKEIIAEENSFGKLKDEDGWIMLAYTKL